jgi:hypothetical protein
MKRALLLAAAVFLAAVIAVVIFVATFDADRLRPQIVSQMQAALGRPVALERVSLGWQQGLAIQLRGLAIQEAAGGEPVAQVELVHGLIQIAPLLKRSIQVSSITLVRPRVRVARDAQGRVELLGLAALGAPVGGAARGAADGGGLSLEVAVLRIEDGAIRWRDATTAPATELSVQDLDVVVTGIAPGRSIAVEARAAVAAERQNVHFRGRLTPPGGGRPGSLEGATLTVEGLALDAVLPPAPRGAPQLQGRLSAELSGDLPSLDPAAFGAAAVASGRIGLAEAKVANLNILRAVFEKFSMIPGLVQKLQERLPPEYQERLAAADTMLQPLDVPVRLEQGRLRLPQLQVVTESLRLSGEGSVGLDGTVRIQSVVRMDPALSSAFVASVKELRALANASGEFEIPVAIEGQAPQIAVVPDLKYVASRVIVTTAVEAIGQLLERELAPRRETPAPDAAAPSDAAQPPADQPPASGEELLGQFLQRALQRHRPQEPAAPSP